MLSQKSQTSQTSDATATRMPRSLKQFFPKVTQQHPDNLALFNIALTPMEPDEWCLIWIPRIYPDIQIPMPGERHPLGYLAACQDVLTYLTGYCPRSIERWLTDATTCKPRIKLHLRLIHIFLTVLRFLPIPLALIKSLDPHSQKQVSTNAVKVIANSKKFRAKL